MCQNVFNKVLLAWFKFQAKIPNCSGIYVQREWQRYTPPFPPLSKDEGLKDIGRSMRIKNLILRVNSVTVWYLIRYDSLLQNATYIITKCDSYILLQNATEVYYKMHQVFYYKMRQLLQMSTILSQNAAVITKCDI